MELSTLGIQSAKIKQFNKKGIFSIEDLARFLPRKYNDFSEETSLIEGEKACVLVTVNNVTRNINSKLDTINAECVVESTQQTVILTWFNQGYRYSEIKSATGLKAVVAGKVSYSRYYKALTIAPPDVFECRISNGFGVYPIYSKIQGMSDEYLRSTIEKALSISDGTKETLPYDLVSDLKLMSTKEALYKLHFPESMEQVEAAQKRILFDDLLYFALHNELASRDFAIGSPFSIKSYGLINQIRDSLPYQLTDDQSEAIKSMLAHVKDGKRINALVQGDVGCGKTIVAFIMMAGFASSGYQTVLMAPTQVLARQHYDDLKALMEPFGYTVAYLGGELKASETKKIKASIEAGDIQLIVGTHSVCSNVTYKNLALTVTDEEHKFGISQKAALVEKAAAGVHSITMSATPIPRSLANVIYGTTVQLHTIVTMPEGRKPVMTGIAKSKEKVYNFIRSQVSKGHQIYVVCPMIDQNDDMEGVKSVEEVSSEYKTVLEPAGIRIETLTGRDKKEVTEETIRRFKAREIDVLISTTVIEVGVNVPNATAIIITSAERFGLSSLHQLRGRVGRSNLQSYCVLETEVQTENSVQRLDAMCRTTNGFEIAEADLQIRGAGDFLGTKQAGNDNKYMSLMIAYPDEYKKAQEIARDLCDNDIKCPMTERVIEERKELNA